MASDDPGENWVTPDEAMGYLSEQARAKDSRKKEKAEYMGMVLVYWQGMQLNGVLQCLVEIDKKLGRLMPPEDTAASVDDLPEELPHEN